MPVRPGRESKTSLGAHYLAEKGCITAPRRGRIGSGDHCSVIVGLFIRILFFAFINLRNVISRDDSAQWCTFVRLDLVIKVMHIHWFESALRNTSWRRRRSGKSMTVPDVEYAVCSNREARVRLACCYRELLEKGDMTVSGSG